MKQFKTRWDIQQNWQLLFPILGVLSIVYSAFRLTNRFFETLPLLVKLLITAVASFLLLKFFLFLFKKLEDKWKVQYKWEMIRIFIVFAITGSSSVFIGKPIINFLGITKENLNLFVYWFLYIIIGLIFYQVLLVTFGWLFGQGKFFWEFEKKMLKRCGFGRLIK